jgi:acyl-CoA thioester hydrolase
LSGTLTAAGHVLDVRIYWEDTDAGGIVYHANYLKFMERGRSDFFRLLGIHQARLQADTGITFAVAKMDIAFKSPAFLDNLVCVKTCFDTIGGASFVLRQTIARDDHVLVTALVTVAALKNGRATRLPAVVVKKIVNNPA